MTKSANAPLRVFRHSGFGFLSSFVIQRFVRVRSMAPMHAEKRKEAFHEPLFRSAVANLLPACSADRYRRSPIGEVLERRTASGLARRRDNNISGESTPARRQTRA